MYLIFKENLVLPVRIELTTSPLPRGCSTTELRQRISVARASATAGRYTTVAPLASLRRRRLTGRVLSGQLGCMEDKPKPRPPAAADAQSRRQDRQAAALRANLARRKQQARERTPPAPAAEKPR